MIPPKLPENELQRQRAVEKYQLLDTLPEQIFDNITSLMSFICDVPISLITLLDKDRNFLKSHHGVPFNESPRSISFCGHTINQKESIMVVQDARLDERFLDNPLVTDYQAVFYAGVPLVDPDGYRLGTLCVYDHKPRELSEKQIEALQNMSKQVMQLFIQHYQNLQLTEMKVSLEERNSELKKFASVVSHDLKSPLANISTLATMIEKEAAHTLDEESVQYLGLLKESSASLRAYIDGLLLYYKSDSILIHDSDSITFHEVIFELRNMLSVSEEQIKVGHDRELMINKTALLQILVNLTSNAFKYNSKASPIARISVNEMEGFYHFEVEDNGIGIEAKYHDVIFDLFTVTPSRDSEGNVGTGIGLATVKKLINKMGGSISIRSEVGEGSTFAFEIAKPF